MTRDDIIRMAREAGFRAGHIELYHFFHQNIASMLRRCYESRCCLSNTSRLPSSPETRMDTRALREYWTSILPLKQQGSQKKHSSLPSLYRIHSRSLKSSAPNRRGPGLLETTPQLKPNPIYIT